MTAEAFVAAVRAGDLAAATVLVDWPVSGIARLMRALTGIEPEGRAAAARTGLANLLAEGGTRPLSLSWLAPCLAHPAGMREPDDAGRAAAIAALAPPDLPAGLDDGTAEHLDRLAARARAVDDVVLLTCGQRVPCALLTGPGIDGVAVVRPVS